ncbi:monocarboxylate transporter 5-like [Dermacentor albipictus]|uniref:monocarboxylate transporter 5-like n=1 Tax=Dermacentor albipictus TaxID=60249 RepID=UPI0031FDF779
MRNRVDCRWDVAAVALVANLFASATNRGMGWFYVAFIEEFSVDRQTASWPGSILLACYRSSGMLVAVLHKRISLFWIGLVGSVFLWGGMMASAFAPSIAWISFTMGFVHGYFRDKMGSYDNLYRIVAGLFCGAGLVLFVYLFRSSRSRRTTMKSSTGAL